MFLCDVQQKAIEAGMNTTLWEPIYWPLESSFLHGCDDRVTVLYVGEKGPSDRDVTSNKNTALVQQGFNKKKQLCLVLIKVKEMTKLSHGFYFIPGIPH